MQIPKGFRHLEELLSERYGSHRNPRRKAFYQRIFLQYSSQEKGIFSFFRNKKRLLQKFLASRILYGQDFERQGLIGRTGTVTTALRPTGIIRIGNTCYEAHARDNQVLAEGTPIEVVGKITHLWEVAPLTDFSTASVHE